MKLKLVRKVLFGCLSFLLCGCLFFGLRVFGASDNGNNNQTEEEPQNNEPVRTPNSYIDWIACDPFYNVSAPLNVYINNYNLYGRPTGVMFKKSSQTEGHPFLDISYTISGGNNYIICDFEEYTYNSLGGVFEYANTYSKSYLIDATHSLVLRLGFFTTSRRNCVVFDYYEYINDAWQSSVQDGPYILNATIQWGNSQGLFYQQSTNYAFLKTIGNGTNDGSIYNVCPVDTSKLYMVSTPSLQTNTLIVGGASWFIYKELLSCWNSGSGYPSLFDIETSAHTYNFYLDKTNGRVYCDIDSGTQTVYIDYSKSNILGIKYTGTALELLSYSITQPLTNEGGQNQEISGNTYFTQNQSTLTILTGAFDKITFNNGFMGSFVNDGTNTIPNYYFTDVLSRINYLQYNYGYQQGLEGENVFSPVWNILSGVFSVVASVLSIELVPHITIGVFFLIPLFFAVLGLILWIWKGKN